VYLEGPGDASAWTTDCHPDLGFLLEPRI